MRDTITPVRIAFVIKLRQNTPPIRHCSDDELVHHPAGRRIGAAAPPGERSLARDSRALLFDNAAVEATLYQILIANEEIDRAARTQPRG